MDVDLPAYIVSIHMEYGSMERALDAAPFKVGDVYRVVRTWV